MDEIPWRGGGFVSADSHHCVDTVTKSIFQLFTFTRSSFLALSLGFDEASHILRLLNINSNYSDFTSTFHSLPTGSIKLTQLFRERKYEISLQISHSTELSSELSSSKRISENPSDSLNIMSSSRRRQSPRTRQHAFSVLFHFHTKILSHSRHWC